MRFTKMEGIGNDYIYINGLEETIADPAVLSVRMSRPHFGCGSDGLILILPSDKADFRMQMFNNDGSESEMCGNGIRCVAKYCHDRGLTDKTDLTIETGAGVKQLHLNVENGETVSVRVDMGLPELNGRKIPTTADGEPVIGHVLTANGHEYPCTFVSMGNPHAVTFVDDPDTAPVTTDGPVLECDPVFPRKANIEFVQVIDPTHVKMRVWERGSGEIMASGTGACAAVVAAVANGMCEKGRDVTVRAAGGDLVVNYTDEKITLTGDAKLVYTGEALY